MCGHMEETTKNPIFEVPASHECLVEVFRCICPEGVVPCRGCMPKFNPDPQNNLYTPANEGVEMAD